MPPSTAAARPAGCLPMPPLHASEVTCFQRCNREWSYAYRDRRVPLVRPEALTRGSSVHRWLNAWWGSCREGRGPRSLALADADLPTDPIARACCLGYAAFWQSPSIDVDGVEVPFLALVGGVEVAGSVDVLGGIDECIIVEHKTTSSDISPGSSYWQQVSTCSVQVSMYAAAFQGARVLFDVIRKPDLEISQVSLCDAAGVPIVLDSLGSRVRKTTGDKGWRRTGDKDKGYVLQTRPETDDELVARCLAAMAEEPSKYFQRATIVRLEHEHAAFARDLQLVDAARRLPEQARNPSSCMAFGRRCGYWDVCWNGASLADDTKFTENDHARHDAPEEIE